MPSNRAIVGLPLAGDGAPPGNTGCSSTPNTFGTTQSPAATLVNLLPLATHDLKLPTGGAYVGEGLPPVPARLAAKIRQWEYIEMGELLPEFWSGPKDGEGEPRERRPRQGRKVAEIFTWLQCYSSFVAVLAPTEPQVIPELMAYMGLIIRVSQDYEGLGWVRYDAAFRRQAALTGNRRWSTINATLFAMNFSGRASRARRCELCFATSHSERECAQRGDPDPDMNARLRNLESAVIAIARPPPSRPASETSPQIRLSDEPCRKWNTSGCSYPRCRYAHVCSSCKGSHPVVRCANRGQAAGKQPSQGAGRPY